MHTTLTSTTERLVPTKPTRMPDPVSPVVNLLETLAAQLSFAQENMTQLTLQLEPIRMPVPSDSTGSNRPPAESPLEGRLADLIDSAAFLNASLANLRAELRI